MIPINTGVFAPAVLSEVQQYLDRMNDTDATLRQDITDLIAGLVADGIWAKLDKLSVAQLREDDSLLNLVSSSYASTNVGASFTADQGFTTSFTSTAYVKTGFTESASSKLSDFDASLFVYRRDTSRDGGAIIGGYNSTVYPEWIMENGTGNSLVGSQQSFTGASTATVVAGFIATSRTDSSNCYLCNKRSTYSATVSGVSKTAPYYEYYLGTFNNLGSLPTTADSWSDGQYAAHGCGAGMTPSELLLLEARLQAYFTARGTAV